MDTPVMRTASSVASTNQTTTAAANANELGPDSFLTLLIAQLKTQDPLSPMDTTAMVNQLATMQMVTESRASRQSQEFSQAAALLGRQVTWRDSATGASRSGEVSSVVRENSEARVVVGGATVALGDLQNISGSVATTGSRQRTP